MSQAIWNGQQVIDEVHVRIKAQMIRIGQQVVKSAETLAPKRTGRLATSISYMYNDATYTVAFVVGAPYGVFVEYGTRHSRPHPYLRPALATYADIYGINTAMVFQNTPHINQPILAQSRGPGFAMPPTLTARQVQHVREHLKPASEYYYASRSNVSRASLHVHRGQRRH